jgi:hypothetical protein
MNAMKLLMWCKGKFNGIYCLIASLYACPAIRNRFSLGIYGSESIGSLFDVFGPEKQSSRVGVRAGVMSSVASVV